MEVQKLESISYRDFVENFHKPGIPVVLKNASKVWKGSSLFSLDYFKKNFGQNKTKVGEGELSIEEIIGLIKTSTRENPAPYPCKFDIRKQLPELLPLIDPLSMNYATPNWFGSKLFPKFVLGNSVDLYFGGPGGRYRLHVDYLHTHAWVTQICGEKNFIVYPRGQEEFLYPKPDYPWISEVDMYNPDYVKFPKFKQATPIVVNVKDGETIFIPSGIWHTTETLTPGAAIIFDQINSTNYDQYMKDLRGEKQKMKAAAISVYAPLAKTLLLANDKFGSKKEKIAS